jgi:hypothetical protein
MSFIKVDFPEPGLPIMWNILVPEESYFWVVEEAAVLIRCSGDDFLMLSMNLSSSNLSPFRAVSDRHRAGYGWMLAFPDSSRDGPHRDLLTRKRLAAV